MNLRTPSPALRYGCAVAAVVIAILARQSLDPWVEARLPFAFQYSGLHGLDATLPDPGDSEVALVVVGLGHGRDRRVHHREAVRIPDLGRAVEAVFLGGVGEVLGSDLLGQWREDRVA